MNTAVTQCPRCTGRDGAHFAFCFVAEVWERLIGDKFPWMPPTPRREPEWEWPLPEEPDDLWEDDLPAFRQPPPADPGVMEDFLVIAGHMESEGDWMADMHEHWEQWHEQRQLDSVTAVTHLPEDYYGTPAEPEPTGCDSVAGHGQLVIQDPKPERKYNTEGLEKARKEYLQGQEDAAVQFVYDRCEFVPGGRVALADVYASYDQWRAEADRPSLSKDRLRDLLVEVGLPVEQGRLPEMRKSGRAPLLVHGVTLRPEVVEPPATPKVVVRTKQKQRDKHALIGAKPGGELPKQVRDLIEPLITEQRWEYQPHNGSGKGRPRLISPDGKTVTLPSTPHLQGRTLENTRSFLKQNGAAL